MASSDNMGPFETVEFSKVRSLAHRFEQAWESQRDSTSGIDLLPFLPELGDPARLPSLFELIKTDLACRWQRGLPTSLEMYVEKFPEIGPLDKISPKLIYEEYRVRTQHGSPAPLNQYKTRFPTQFADFESLIQTEQSGIEQLTAVSNPNSVLDVPAQPSSPLSMVGNGTLVGGHYTLDKRIGTGGFGEVWLGNDIHGNIPKAVKIITRSVESDEAKQELHALEIIKRLNHPFLLRTEGFFAEQERLIVVMELADGSLRDMLKKVKKESDRGIPVEKLLTYMRHAAEALDYLHEEGIFHRDIKPENILLVGKIAKVADFGLAKLAANRQSTKTNFAGTSAYSSPETWKGRVTAKSDLYSLAVTYAELRLGRSVFKGSTIYEFMIEHLQTQPNLDPIPDAEKEVILQALSKEPADRHASCSEFVADLQRAVTEPGSLPTAGSGPRAATSVSGARTPVTKWNTPASPRPGSSASMNANTHTPGKSPPAWNKPQSRADIEMSESEPSPRYGRRRQKVNPILVGAGLTFVLTLVAIVASFIARSGVASTAKELAGKGDFGGALKSINDGNFLMAPFREGLREDVLKQGLEMAEKAKKNENLKELIATTAALSEAFPKDDNCLDLLKKALSHQIPEMLQSANYAEAYELVKSIKIDFPAKHEQINNVTKKWLDRAMDEIGNDDYAAAMKITSEFLQVDPRQGEARALHDLASAAENLNNDILMGKFHAISEKLSRPLPAKVQKLGQHLRGQVKTAWLKQAERMNEAKKYNDAQQCLNQFAEVYKNDPEGNAALKSTFKNLFKELYAKDKYEDALESLKKTNFGFPDLVDEVKEKWREAELTRFKSGDDVAKQRALQGLQALSKQFGSDFDLQDVYREYRGEYLKTAFKRIDANLKVKNYPQALEQIGKVRNIVEGDQEIKLKSMQLLALTDRPETTAGDRDAIKLLLHDVMKQPENADYLEQILDGVIKIGVANVSFAEGIEHELLAFRHVFDDSRLPADFWKLPGMTKGLSNADDFGPRKILGAATKQFNSQEYEKSLATLKQINVRKEADKNLRRDYYMLYAKLGEKGVLTRTEVLDLKPAAQDHPEIKTYLAKAMTQTIARSWKTWPQEPETWTTRIADADQAEANSEIVKAFKAEGLLFTKKPVDFELLPGKGGEKTYIDYVRACKAATKPEGIALAARTLETISPAEIWLAPERRERIIEILQSAAVDIAKSPDGSRRLFDSTVEAKNAYLWLDKALQFSEKLAKDGLSLPWDSELTLALAAACKVPPKFDLNKTLGDDLLSTHRSKLKDGDRINLVLSNPAAFAEELKSLKAEELVGVNEISGILLVGESQIEAAADIPELTQRQGLLYALKGWALEKAQQKDNDAIFTAYSKAATLNPDNNTILLAKGRFGAIKSLAAAKKEQNSVAKISFLKQGVTACGPALRKNLVDEEEWADLCLQRSQLALELGNIYFVINEPDELKSSFEDARLYAEKARNAKIPHKKEADVWLALGNALEDLAYFARVEKSKNFEESTKAFDRAGKLEPEYQYNSGRARFRWATATLPEVNEAKKSLLLNTAVINLAGMASDKKGTHAAEACYFEGSAHWHLGNLTSAIKSFERCLTVAQKKDDDTIWAKWSIDFAIQLTREQLKANPERSLKWIEDAELAFRPFKGNPFFEGVERQISDITAEAAIEIAYKAFDAQDVNKLKAYGDRALQLKHSTKGHEFAVGRAFKLKASRAKLELTPQNLNAIYDQTISAIDGMTNFDDAQKQKLRTQFDSLWKKGP